MSEASSKRIRVALIFGGRSSEHAVSCATAASVLKAIDRSRYEVVPIGISRRGDWVLMADDPAPLQLTATHTPEVSGDANVVLRAEPGSTDLIVLEPGQPPRELHSVDVVFPLLHGPFGEDGTLQGLLELAERRYVGSGVSASAVMMDKHLMKVVFSGAGLPVGPYVVITDKEWQRDPAASLDACRSLGLPCFVKPARAGSSVGVVRVDRAEDLPAAIETAREHDPKVLVEAAIVGRELECGILEGHGSDAPRASVIGEIAMGSVGSPAAGAEFYDFDAKYLHPERVRISAPAEVSREVAREIQDLSVRAFDAAGCEGLARVDWFYGPDGKLYLNEINTMPGFTPVSMFPQVWAASGMSYPELINELISLALERRIGLR